MATGTIPILTMLYIEETPNKNQGAWYTIKEPFNEVEEKFFEKLVILMTCGCG